MKLIGNSMCSAFKHVNLMVMSQQKKTCSRIAPVMYAPVISKSTPFWQPYRLLLFITVILLFLFCTIVALFVFIALTTQPQSEARRRCINVIILKVLHFTKLMMVVSILCVALYLICLVRVVDENCNARC